MQTTHNIETFNVTKRIFKIGERLCHIKEKFIGGGISASVLAQHRELQLLGTTWNVYTTLLVFALHTYREILITLIEPICSNSSANCLL